MKKVITTILTLTLAIVLTGCAAVYRPIQPQGLNYNSHDLQDGIGFSYKYDVLVEKGNKKYAKKEEKAGVKLVAIKITNGSGSIINLSKNCAFFDGKDRIYPMIPIATKESIKQNVPGYLPYLFLSLVHISVYTETSVKTYKNAGAIPGIGLAAGNMIVAGTSNTNMLNELYKYDILNRDIQDGETVYGIIGVRNIGFIPMTIKMIK